MEFIGLAWSSQHLKSVDFMLSCTLAVPSRCWFSAMPSLGCFLCLAGRMAMSSGCSCYLSMSELMYRHSKHLVYLKEVCSRVCTLYDTQERFSLENEWLEFDSPVSALALPSREKDMDYGLLRIPTRNTPHGTLVRERVESLVLISNRAQWAIGHPYSIRFYHLHDIWFY